MKRTLLSILTIFCSVFVFSQNESAKQILQDVREHYNEDYSFEADFIMEIDIPETATTVMDGTLSLSGQQFKFETEDQIVISDNVNLWYWTNTSTINEVQISYVEESEDIISPSDIFGIYLKGFLYKIIGKTKSGGKELTLIELIPSTREETNPYFKVKVVVDTATSQLQQLQVFYKDGTVYTFKIKNEKASDFEEDYFEFDAQKNPETEIIDLR